MIMQPSPFGVAPPAWKFVAILLVAAVVLGVIYWPLALVPMVLALYVCWFFRDPNRKCPRIPGSFCSPADGKVVSVIEVPCPEMPGGRARRIAIFLNIFNVHIQRMPYAGKVTAIIQKEGKFINALNEKCSEENEQVTVWMEGEGGLVFGVRQIAGAIARRIVCYVENGEELQRGDRYGLIQFGSRVELFLPLTATVKVTPGQKVTGAQTCLAILDEEAVKRPDSASREAAKVNP